MRSIMSAQSLASVPPSRALIVKIALRAASFGPLKKGLEVEIIQDSSRAWSTSVGHFSRNRFVLVSHFQQGFKVVYGAGQIVQSVPTIALESLLTRRLFFEPASLSSQKFGFGHLGFDRSDLFLAFASVVKESLRVVSVRWLIFSLR